MKERIKSILKKPFLIASCLVMAAFLVYLLFLYHKVFIYFDDYGYLSLTYGTDDIDPRSLGTGIMGFFRYVAAHHRNANGRLLYTMLFPVLYLAGGLGTVQTFMACCVAAVVSLGVSLAWHQLARESTCNENHREKRSAVLQPFLLAVLACILYGLIDIKIQKSGTYWFAAAFTYVVPAISFLLFSNLYFQSQERETVSLRRQICCVLLAFTSAFSQEQWAAAVFGCIFLNWGRKKRMHRKWFRYDFAVGAAAVIGILPIVTSPGIGVRVSKSSGFLSLSWPQRILENTGTITRLFFAPANRTYLLIFLLLILSIIGYEIIRSRKMRVLQCLFFLCTLAWEFAMYFQKYYKAIWRWQKTTAGTVCMFLYILAMSAEILFFLCERNNIQMAFLYVSAFLSMACLIVVPSIPKRTLLPFLYLSFPWLLYAFGVIFLQGERKLLTAGLLALCLFGWKSLGYMADIYQGYEKNWVVHQKNDALARECSEQVKNGEDVTSLCLYKVPDKLYGGRMAYEKGFEYMVWWMRWYYDLPEDFVIEYYEE